MCPASPQLVLVLRAYLLLRNVINAAMTTPMATASARIFWIMMDPVSVPVTRLATSCCTMMKTTRPMATETKPLVTAHITRPLRPDRAKDDHVCKNAYHVVETTTPVKLPSHCSPAADCICNTCWMVKVLPLATAKRGLVWSIRTCVAASMLGVAITL